MNARRSRPMFPRFAHLTSRLFDQSTKLLPGASRQLPPVFCLLQAAPCQLEVRSAARCPLPPASIP